MLDPEQWGEFQGVANPRAALATYREQGRLFAVRVGAEYLYPRFQFSGDASPIDAIADILKVVPEDAKGWPLLSWFEAPNIELGGRVPRDVVAETPCAVKRAAESFYGVDSAPGG